MIASAFFLLSLDGSIITTSFPPMARSFGVSVASMSSGVTAYILATAAFLPVSGWIADRFGARNVLAAAVAGFTAASLACGLSETLVWFTIGRAAQGVAAALILPIGRVIVLRNAKQEEIIQTQTLLSWPMLVAPVLGPVLGGFITTYISWRGNFFVNIPIGLLGLGCILRIVDNDDISEPRPIDAIGFILSGSAIGCIIFGLTDLTQATPNAFRSWFFLASGAIAAFLVVVHFRTTRHPLLRLEPLAVPTFRFSTLWAGSLFRLALNSTPFLLALLFQVAEKRTAIETGGLLLWFFAGNLAAKTRVRYFLRRFGYRNVLLWNGVLLAVTNLAFVYLNVSTPRILTIAVLFVAGLSRSMQFSGLSTLAFADVPVAHRSSAVTLNEMMAQLGSGLGVALAALTLQKSAVFLGHTELSQVNFQAAFALAAAAAAGGVILTFRLNPTAGDNLVHNPGHKLGGATRPS